MKKIFILFLLMSSLSYSQKERTFKLGKTTLEEIKMSTYEKDTTANALVLHEKGQTYLSERHNLDFRTDYYHRIKLFDKKEFERATVSIELYDKERAEDIEAYSYHEENGKIVKTKLQKEQIFDKDLNEKWKEIVFTIPNLKEGSVIEYKYSVISPYTSIDNWYFQSDIPKLKSDYKFIYLGNYKYNVRLLGFLKLDRDDASVRKNCVDVPGIGVGSCGVLEYGMDHVPAFTEEQYMLSKENFISHMKFDLISITRTDGRVKSFTQTWEDTDKNFEKNYLDGQTNKDRFFEKYLPEGLLAIQDPLEKTKKVYKHIQNHFTWNDQYWSFKNINLRDAYNQKKGGVDAINLSLYNSLQAANIESYIMMIATRDKAIPTKLYPVTKDFNYIIVKAVVDGKTYFLDATQKFLSFGQLPMRCLNGEGRVLDFKNGSYWEEILPVLKNRMRIWVQLEINDENELVGKVNVGQGGYFASDTREEMSRKSKDQYLNTIESRMIDYEIENYDIKAQFDLDKKLSESFTLVPDEAVFDADKIRINPFFYHRVQTNPFQLNERSYPVDFGYPRMYTYTVTLDVPKGYQVSSIPEETSVKTAAGSAEMTFRSNQIGEKITMSYKYQIKKKVYSSDEYYQLKEFYNKLIALHKSNIVFQKI
jgi:hypothetical protein